MAGDTGGNVNQRIYGYRLGGVAGKEMRKDQKLGNNDICEASGTCFDEVFFGFHETA